MAYPPIGILCCRYSIGAEAEVAFVDSGDSPKTGYPPSDHHQLKEDEEIGSRGEQLAN